MITRIYIDNYKCFSNFEYRPAANELLLGRNGAGKSSVFDVLRMLKNLIHQGLSVMDCDLLGLDTLTRWDTRDVQRFEMDVDGREVLYRYSLTLEYDRDASRYRIGEETLDFAPHDAAQYPSRLFTRRRDEGQLFRDDGSEGPNVMMDWHRSGLYSIQPRHDNTRLTWFKERVGRTHCIRIVPALMSGWTVSEDDAPNSDLSNYASWYRHLNQEEPRVRELLHQSLREVIDGFSTFSLKRVTEEGRRLCADLETDGKPFTYDLSQLSDGQRALVALYTFSAYASEFAGPRDKPITLCLDEPENYVALSEIQPWILEIGDCADGEHAQLLMASHHPELIDHYAHTSASLFYRDDGGPVQTKPFGPGLENELPPSEIVARGWEDE
ncbi:MAG: AAA family ATPase [Armatimonadetes bacterium]|nr:AAA family ATPase [Armatimonadota bacterium]MDI9585037.1 AAA family ATPase [Acidobacteriota bacterium]